jgi:antitoxin component of RelBE/YafQ-DinJ toxin-antitoxin module
MSVEPRRRKRRLHLYLREDIAEALERVAEDSGLTVSQVVEIVLGFYWELNSVARKAEFVANVHRSFHKTP